jgi:hypothetical protein
MEFELTWIGPSLVVCRNWGPASAKDYEQLLRTLTSSPEVGPDTRVLMDFSAVDVSGVTAADMEQVADIRSRFAGDRMTRAAMVVGPDSPLRYGLGRMFQAHLTSQAKIEVRVFEEFDEAMAWLQADDTDAAN